MSLSHSPKVVTDGLVFYTDMSNTDKSWRGAPTTNLITNPLPNGTTTGFAAIGGVGTLTYDIQNEAIKWVRTSYEVWGAYHTITPIFNGTLSTSVQYSISFEWKVEGNAFSNNVYVYELVQGNAVSPAGTANLVANSTLQPNGWFLFKYTFTPANAGVGEAYNRIYFPSQSTNTSTFYWRKIQFEQNAFATPFVAGTRSNTQAVFDITRRNTLTANSLSYASNNTFSFNGTTDFLSMDYVGSGPAFTHEVFLRPTDISKDQMYIGYNNIGAHYVRILSSRAFLSVSTTAGQRTFHDSQVLTNNTNYHIVSCYNGVQHKIYINGVLSTGSALNEPLSGWGTSRIGRWQDGDQRSFVGTIFNLKTYNRELSAQEVLQNFNALRGRYGI